MSQTHSYQVTPWRAHCDLLAVKELIFGSPDDTNSNGHDLKTATGQLEESYIAWRHAAVTIDTWKLRGNLPHAVESTGSILQALVFHDESVKQQVREHGFESDTYAIRATYTMALTRFVTGFADLGRSRAGMGQSMLDVAKDINLPVRFVEMRHEATHEDMPSLSRLVELAREALDWLFVAYWSTLAEAIEQDDEEHSRRAHQTRDRDEIQVEMRQTLRGFRNMSKDDLRNGRSTTHDLVEQTSRELILLAEELGKGGYRLLSDCFWQPGMLIPVSSISLDSSMETACGLWKDLLEHLTKISRYFVKSLLSELVQHIAKEREPVRIQVLNRWIQIIFEGRLLRLGQSQRHFSLACYTVRQCLLEPCAQTQTIAAKVLGVLPKESDDARDLSELYRVTFEDPRLAADEDGR